MSKYYGFMKHKPWEPTNFQNQEKLWKAENSALHNLKMHTERIKEIDQEREIAQLQMLNAKRGLVSKTARMAFELDKDEEVEDMGPQAFSATSLDEFLKKKKEADEERERKEAEKQQAENNSGDDQADNDKSTALEADDSSTKVPVEELDENTSGSEDKDEIEDSKELVKSMFRKRMREIQAEVEKHGKQKKRKKSGKEKKSKKSKSKKKKKKSKRSSSDSG